MSKAIDGILKRLQSPGAAVLELLPFYQDKDHEGFWRKDPRLYRAFTRKLISAGHPTRAFELAREGLVYHPDDPDLKYLIALALARGGNIPQAEAHLAKLLQTPDLGPEPAQQPQTQTRSHNPSSGVRTNYASIAKGRRSWSARRGNVQGTVAL